VAFGAPGPAGEPGGAATFDGRGAHVLVPDAPGLRLGRGDFSVAAWVHTPAALDDGLGDVCAKFDPVRRRGFTLGLLHLTGVTSHQPNSRQAYFGVDAGSEPVWTDAGRPGNGVMVKALAVHDGSLYAGTYEAGAEESGRVYRYAGDAAWEDCGRLGGEQEVMGMVAYHGKLYAGTLPLAEVYRYDPDDQPHPGGPGGWAPGGAAWTRVGRLDHTPDVRYRRVWSMALHDGRLFAGTLPSGRVWALAAGQGVTSGRELPAGWCHLAAVRRGGRLTLYLDGRPVAAGGDPAAPALDVSTDAPLRLGAGPHDSLNGRLADVRLYRRALAPPEVGALAGAGAGRPPA
jgi:hypothetical protein